MSEFWKIFFVTVYTSCALVLFVYGINCYVMMWLFSRARRQQKDHDQRLLEQFSQRFSEKDLPPVTVQLPVYNERLVIDRLLTCACALDWPKGKLEIQVLDDSTDDSWMHTAELVEKLRKQGHDIQHIRRTNRQGFKAGALRNGMKLARGEFFAIFDADFTPPPDFLRRTVPFLLMDEKCGFVQARWGHRNRDYSPFTRAQSIGIDGHFAVEQPARAWNGLFLNFNGTAGVWRKQAIEQAGGWQDDTLTEDLDLSYRSQLAGWHGRFLPDLVVPAELPTNINAFKSQQRRWAKGSIQTAKKLLPRVIKSSNFGPFKKLQAVLHLTHYLVHPTIILMVLFTLPLLLSGRAIFVTPLVLSLVGMMVFSLFAPSALYLFSQKVFYPGDWKNSIKYLPLLTIMGMGLAVNNSVGVLGAIFGKKHEEFVRTPKLGTLAEIPSVNATSSGSLQVSVLEKKVIEYRIPIKGSVLFEWFMCLWALAAFFEYIRIFNFIIGPIMLLHATGFAYVGVTSFVHDLKLRRLGDRS